MPQLIQDPEALRLYIRELRKKNKPIALVPTMGALHAGHVSLVHHARDVLGEEAAIIVSIFVNPTQFGPNEDFDKYPRTLDADRALLQGASVDAVYAPSVQEMYPEGCATSVHVRGLTEYLCGAARPGHFDGVCTVVSKLLLQTLPDIACFGEKDYQQYRVIDRMVRDLNLPVEIVPVPTMREADGLALSSRNRYLSSENRAIAPAIHQALERAATRILMGDEVEKVLKEGRDSLLKSGFSRVDYFDLRDAHTLAALNRLHKPARLFTAAVLDGTRLIDNRAVE